MNRKLTEKELLSSLDEAIEKGWIFACFQPKVNHSTKRIIGAEALMRWRDPEAGMQYPSDFIPVLENAGMLWKADLAIFERVCSFQERALASDIHPVPVSFNISRFDILHDDYTLSLEEIRKRHGVPVRLLHAEITESSVIGGPERVAAFVSGLQEIGYKVEMDDFGSGYSSLNVLKDLPFDFIKLDMRFFSGGMTGRGGAIINAVVQMARWLHTPVIAEGLETEPQADFMESIGCSYIQGYLYSKPVPEEEFRRKLETSASEPVAPAIELPEEMDAGKFWDPSSMETLIFNSYVGGAAIISLRQGRIEILRVNRKYSKEIGLVMSDQEILRLDALGTLDTDNRRVYLDALRRASETGEEQSCETWRTICSKCCGSDRICVRSFIRELGRAGDQTFYYVMVQNITAEKKSYDELLRSEKRYHYAAEHDSSFAWEYDIRTHEMRPCSRCIRELGLPAVIRDYPEPVIKSRLFQPDFADEYREWYRKLAEGVPYLEDVMLLTDNRIPFRVAYTNEFDEAGRPLRAYGSATPVSTGEKKD